MPNYSAMSGGELTHQAFNGDSARQEIDRRDEESRTQSRGRPESSAGGGTGIILLLMLGVRSVIDRLNHALPFWRRCLLAAGIAWLFSWIAGRLAEIKAALRP
jgi:hypothetical protein